MSNQLPKTQQAAVVAKLGPNAEVEVKEIPVPDAASLKAGECIIKMDCSGVCHSDLSIKNYEYPMCAIAKLPLIGGHEGVGTIVALGDHTPESSFKVGQRVGIKWLASTCLHCEACRQGSEWHCPQMSFSGLNVGGTFQQYAVGYVNGLVAIPDGITSQDACPILCAGVTVYRALKQSNANVGDYISISGAGGGLGHLAIQYANAMGFRVVAIDTGAEKKALCESLGAVAWVDFKEVSDVVKAVVAATGGKGPKAALVTAASTGPYQQALDYLGREGTLLAVGLPPDEGKLSVNIMSLVGKMQRIQASYVGNRQDTSEALNLVATGKVKPHYELLALKDLPHVYDQMKSGKLTGRVVLNL